MRKIIKKKHLVICLVTIMLVGLVAVASVAEEEKWEDRPVEITVTPFYNWPLDKTGLQMLTEEPLYALTHLYSTILFNVTHPDIRINFQVSQDAWGAREARNKDILMTALAAGEAPAVYFLDMLGDPASMAGEGYAADITDLVNQWDLKDWLLENRGGLWAPMWQKGRCYGVPNYNYSARVVTFRKDWFKEAGIFNEQGEPGPSPEWTTSDFLDISRKVSNPKKERWAITISGVGWREPFVEYIFQAFGVPLLIPDPSGEYTWQSAFDIPEAQAVYDFYKELLWNQKSVLTSTGAEPLGAGMDFMGGKTAMDFRETGNIVWRAAMSTDHWKGPSFAHITGTPEDMALWESAGIVPMPKGPEGIRLSTNAAWVYAINPTLSEEQKKAAWEWLLWEELGNGNRERVSRTEYLIRTQQDTFANSWPQTYPNPKGIPSLLMKDYIPKWIRTTDITDKDPAPPAAPAYGLPVLGMKGQLTSLIETIISDPNADFQKMADAAANLINKGVLDYKVEGQTMEDFKKYYTAMDAFYKENFPEYYEKTFKKLYEKYYKVW